MSKFMKLEFLSVAGIFVLIVLIIVLMLNTDIVAGTTHNYASIQQIKYNAAGQCIDSSIVNDKSVITVDESNTRVYLISPRLGTLMFIIMSIDYKFGAYAPVFIVMDPYHKKSGLLMLNFSNGSAVLYFNNQIIKLGKSYERKIPGIKR